MPRIAQIIVTHDKPLQIQCIKVASLLVESLLAPSLKKFLSTVDGAKQFQKDGFSYTLGANTATWVPMGWFWWPMVSSESATTSLGPSFMLVPFLAPQLHKNDLVENLHPWAAIKSMNVEMFDEEQHNSVYKSTFRAFKEFAEK